MFYSFACVAVRLLLRLLTRFQVQGLENVPSTGPLLMVCNHIGFVDPPVLGALLPRRIVFMAKEEAFRAPITGGFVRWYGAFPVRRGQADRQALRRSLDVLQEGAVVGMFPEGTRSKTGSMKESHAGAALIALLSGAPILPVAITGTDQIRPVFSPLTRPRIRVRVGQPFTLGRKGSGKSDLEAATRSMMVRVAALLPESRRGFYAAAVAELEEADLSP